MMKDTTQQTVLFPDLFKKPLVVKFDQPQASSDGGAVLLKACDESLALTRRLSGCIADVRQAGKVSHTV